MIDAADHLEDLRSPPGNRLHALKEDRIGQHSVSIITSGVYSSSGRTEALTMSKSSITTNPDWLHNSHAGELLVSEFLEPLELKPEALAAAIDVPADDVQAVIEGRQAMSAELDLRLGRYFRMSEGFFLRLQDQYALLEAKRALNCSLDLIVPRAA